MRQYMEYCRPANVISAHHVKKTASFDDAPNLEDLSQAGIAEFAGNYWLMGRMGEYVGDGMHKLAVRYGGRDEQFGLLKLDFDERKWTAEFSSLVDHREDLKVRKETEQVNAMTAKILKELKRYRDGRLRETVQQDQFPANQHYRHPVHPESFNCGSPGVRSAANSPSDSEGEMV